MGTNHYRIISEEEMKAKHEKLLERIQNLDLSSGNIEREFCDIEKEGQYDKTSAWFEFIEGNAVHIGKSSCGWKFLFNHNNWTYYKDMDELKAFIKSGRLVDEYGKELNQEEFWEFVEEKQKDPNSIDGKGYYENPKFNHGSFDSVERARENNYHEEIKWGYRFSDSTDFS
jgi:hypothetical protein